MRVQYVVPLLLVLAGCGSIGVGRGEPAPEPGRDLTTWLVTLEGREGHDLWVRNDSERIHRITCVTLTDCVNVEEACGDHALDVVLCPGDSRRVFTVHAESRESAQQLFFRWDYGARSYDAGEPVVGASCPGGTP